MAPLPLPVSSSPGARPQESAGRLVNAYAVKMQQGARSPFKWVRSPGLDELIEVTGRSGYRGFLEIAGGLFAVLEDRVVNVTNGGGTVLDIGALGGTDLVTIAKNNATTPDYVCVTGDGVFNLFPSSPPTSFADSDLPGSPLSVSHLNGYFLFVYGDRRIFASELNSVEVSSLSRTQAQGNSRQLLRGVAFRGEFFAFGEDDTVVYADRGLTPFPLDKVTVIPIGIAATHAVAGWEPGFAGTLMWAAGDDTVKALNGYNTETVSNEDVSRAIAATPDKSVLRASCYMSNGNAFWNLSRPGFWTWEFNLSTAQWNERASNDRTDWRVSRTVRAFGKWLGGESDTGWLSVISDTAYRERNEELIWQVTSGALAAPPFRVGAPRLDVDMTAGVGVAEGPGLPLTNPRIRIDWSLDGGHTYGTPVLRTIGSEGNTDRIVFVSSLGISGSKGHRVRFTGSDPAPYTLMGATVTEPQKRAAA